MAAGAKQKKRRKRAREEDHAKSERVLSEVDLAIPQGSFFGIAGATGSGKSTLLLHIDALLAPTEGSVTVDGLRTDDPRDAALIRSRCAYLFQYPERQLFAATVEEDISFGPKNLGWSKDRIDTAVRIALRETGLDEDVLTRSPHRLSGGQQRRVALAGALACEPSVLILDEPAAGLDPKGHADIMELLSRLHAQGTTIVMASHCMDDLAARCTRIAVLDHGTCLKCDSPEQIFDDRKLLQKAGLDVPSAQALANALHDKGVPLPRKLYSESSLLDALGRI